MRLESVQAGGLESEAAADLTAAPVGLDRLAHMITELFELTGAGDSSGKAAEPRRRLTTISMSIRTEREHVFVSLNSVVTSGLSLPAAATQLRRPPTLQGA